MQLSLTDLRLFVAAAEYLNLTRAAECCHLSVAAVSNRVRAIERQARCRLLERQARGVRLTAAGEAFARHARTILQEATLLSAELGEFAGGLQGHITVLANTTACTEIMPAVLAGFLSSHPLVSVNLKEHSNPEIARSVREGRADIGLLAGELDLRELSSVRFATDRVVLVVARGHRFARRAKVSFAEIFDHPIVGLQEGTTLQTFLAERVEAMGRPQPRPRAQVSNFEALCLMAEAGVGLGVAPESVVRRYMRSMRIVAVPLSDEWSLRNRYVVLRDMERAPQYLRDLVASICAHNGPFTKIVTARASS